MRPELTTSWINSLGLGDVNLESYGMVERPLAALVSGLLGLCACVLASCSSNAPPERWTLWYIPNEPAIVEPPLARVPYVHLRVGARCQNLSRGNRKAREERPER